MLRQFFARVVSSCHRKTQNTPAAATSAAAAASEKDDDFQMSHTSWQPNQSTACARVRDRRKLRCHLTAIISHLTWNTIQVSSPVCQVFVLLHSQQPPPSAARTIKACRTKRVREKIVLTECIKFLYLTYLCCTHFVSPYLTPTRIYEYLPNFGYLLTLLLLYY